MSIATTLPSILDEPPDEVREDLAALRTLLADVPAKQLERNLLIATWNIRELGPLARTWAQPKGEKPARDLRALRCIGEIVSRFDVVAIQEVQRDIGALQALMVWLGPDWGFTMTDVTRGSRAASERLAFVFDTRRVRLSGLAAELVLSPEDMDGTDPERLHQQLARTPYSVAFVSKGHTFVLTSVHIRWGKGVPERKPEIRAIAEWLDRSRKEIDSADHDLIALGDWNIPKLGDGAHAALTSTGLRTPPELDPGSEPAYDQIAWFPDTLVLRYTGRGGRVRWRGRILTDLDDGKDEITYRISDHTPLWVEFAVSETAPV